MAIDADQDPAHHYDDSTVYKWTIRSLYAAALGLNVYLLWRAAQDDTEMEITKAKLKRAVGRITAPIRRERQWRRSVGRMHWAALMALDETEETEADG